MWDKLNYRSKNKLLIAAAVLLFIICWWLSFSKTFSEIGRHRSLVQAASVSGVQGDQTYQLEKKAAKLDTLIQHYGMDSVAFENNFLQDVSLAIEGLPVRLSYDGSKQPTEKPASVLQKEIILQGKYSDIVKALAALERVYFVSGLVYQKEGYRVVLGRVRD